MIIESVEQFETMLREDYGITTETARYADIENGQMIKEYRIFRHGVFSRTEDLWLREVPDGYFPDGLYQMHADCPLPFVLLYRSGHPLRRIEPEEIGNDECVS